MPFNLLVGCDNERQSKKFLPIIRRHFNIPSKFIIQGLRAESSGPGYKHFAVFYAQDEHAHAHRSNQNEVSPPREHGDMADWATTVQLGMRHGSRRP